MIPHHLSGLPPVAHHEPGQNNPASIVGKVARKVSSGIVGKLATFNLKFLAASMQAFAQRNPDQSHDIPSSGADAAGHIDKHRFMLDIFSLARAQLKGHEQEIYTALKKMEKTMGTRIDWSKSPGREADSARRSLAEAGRKNALALIDCNPVDDATTALHNADSKSSVDDRASEALPSEIELQQELLKKKSRENIDRPSHGQNPLFGTQEAAQPDREQ